MQDILSSLDAIEVIFIKATSTVSVLIICFFMTRSHVQHFLAKRKKRNNSHSGQRPNKNK
jgi:hypothetical protein